MELRVMTMTIMLKGKMRTMLFMLLLMVLVILMLLMMMLMGRKLGNPRLSSDLQLIMLLMRHKNPTLSSVFQPRLLTLIMLMLRSMVQTRVLVSDLQIMVPIVMTIQRIVMDSMVFIAHVSG